jgi:hypothetical protein
MCGFDGSRRPSAPHRVLRDGSLTVNVCRRRGRRPCRRGDRLPGCRRCGSPSTSRYSRSGVQVRDHHVVASRALDVGARCRWQAWHGHDVGLVARDAGPGGLPISTGNSRPDRRLPDAAGGATTTARVGNPGAAAGRAGRSGNPPRSAAMSLVSTVMPSYRPAPHRGPTVRRADDATGTAGSTRSASGAAARPRPWWAAARGKPFRAGSGSMTGAGGYRLGECTGSGRQPPGSDSRSGNDDRAGRRSGDRQPVQARRASTPAARSTAATTEPRPGPGSRRAPDAHRPGACDRLFDHVDLVARQSPPPSAVPRRSRVAAHHGMRDVGLHATTANGGIAATVPQHRRAGPRRRPLRAGTPTSSTTAGSAGREHATWPLDERPLPGVYLIMPVPPLARRSVRPCPPGGRRP